MARKSNPVAKQIEESTCRVIRKRPVKFVPTPSTMMNLACTDTSGGGFGLGKMVNLIGDSSTGKSIFAISTFAEMAQRSEYDKYDFIYDDAEWANSFDMVKLFGQQTAERIIPPAEDEQEDPIFSRTIEDFHCNILNTVDRGNPFVYVLDSFDALDADADKKKVEEMRTARAKGNQAAGSYQMSKPKKASELLRNTVDAISETDSLLIVVSQTRDNINPMSFERVTRSGGKALKFYCTHEVWLAHKGKLTSREEVIGNNVRAKVSKNKITGKVRQCEFPIYNDYGVDDLRSMIRWMVEKKYFVQVKNTINAEGLGIKGTYPKLIKEIEADDMEDKLRKLVGEAWIDFEDSLKLGRKPRYI